MGAIAGDDMAVLDSMCVFPDHLRMHKLTHLPYLDLSRSSAQAGTDMKMAEAEAARQLVEDVRSHTSVHISNVSTECDTIGQMSRRKTRLPNMQSDCEQRAGWPTACSALLLPSLIHI